MIEKDTTETLDDDFEDTHMCLGCATYNLSTLHVSNIQNEPQIGKSQVHENLSLTRSFCSTGCSTDYPTRCLTSYPINKYARTTTTCLFIFIIFIPIQKCNCPKFVELQLSGQRYPVITNRKQSSNCTLYQQGEVKKFKKGHKLFIEKLITPLY